MPAELRRVTLALASLLTCCHSPKPPVSNAPVATSLSSPCRVGPDGAPVSADRGIGGTGSPPLIADRGIGGTGEPPKTNLADRGIGGTGIIGVITGFASVCLAGQEVALPPDAAVAIDQRAAGPDSLRAGQVAAIDAITDPTGLRARRIVIRYEVVGPVERVNGDMIRVAGQDVALTPQTWGTRPDPGDWVAVSGLRRGDATIEATRVERQPKGPILVHGVLIEDDGSLRIGALAIRRDPAAAALIGQDVTITGITGQNGELLPYSVTPDLLLIDPAAYFGPQVGVVLIEGFAVVDAGRVRLAPGFSAPAPGLRLDGSHRGVYRFERFGDGLRATSVDDAPGRFNTPPRFEPTPRFEPAPVPNRALGGPGSDRGAPGARADDQRPGGGNRAAAPRGRFARPP